MLKFSMAIKGAYVPQKWEPEILQYWLKNKFYKPEYDPKTGKLLTLDELKKDKTPTYCIIMPPPNAYGIPHMGNVSSYAYEDLYLRFYRMHGYKAYGQPGKDHAGIQGEIVVLREYFKPQGKGKHNMSREEFYKETYKFFTKNMKEATKIEQRIGISADFDRNVFTLDPDIVKIVLTTFKKLWDDGLVYKGVRIVNWCPSCKTALADIDTEKKERQSIFAYIKYPLLPANTKVWNLSFYKKEIINALKKGTKTIETRALNPEEPHSFFGEIKEGDIIVAVDKSKDSHQGRTPFLVKRVAIYKNIKELYKNEDITKISSDGKKKSLEEFSKMYESLAPGYLNKINKNGIIAIEVERYSPRIKLNIVFATSNQDKQRHLASYFRDYGIKLLLPKAHPKSLEENGITFEENAKIKALAYSKLYPQKIVIATDAGLTVPFLKDKWNPLYTRRFVGDNKSDLARAKKFLELLEDAKGGQRAVDWNEGVAVAYNGKLLFSKTYVRKQAGIVMENIPSDFKETGYWAAYIIRYPNSNYRWIDKIDKSNQKSWAAQFTNDLLEILYKHRFLNFITVATTRPETMLGDTAVVVNPTDKRYKKLIGRKVLLPLVWREIPIISDPRVEKDLGTGALKLTPAHAYEDYEIMLTWNNEHKHEPQKQVDYINVINKNAQMVGPVGKYYGLTTEQAKQQVLDDLKTFGLLEKIEEKQQFVQVCERCKTVIEPQMSSQWFIKINALKKPAIDVVKQGKIKIHPQNMIKKYMHWMNNLRDWPISRSLWWGYRFPVWYKGKLEETINENGKIITKIGNVEVKDIQDAVKKGLAKVSLEKPEGEEWVQDKNVFDTWFSSGQWPFATLMKYNLMDKFYPTNLMETGYDILEFWVSRMIMLGLYRTGEIPFKDVYLHGLILAEDGQKMSKSKGNVIDPRDVFNEYGADALRLAYLTGAKAGAGTAIGKNKLEGNKRFLNKLWNIAKFVQLNIKDVKNEIATWDKNSIKLQPEDEKMLQEVTNIKQTLEKGIKEFKFGPAIIDLRNSVWHVFADEYIEQVKPRLYNADSINSNRLESKKAAQFVLYTTLREYLKMLHPIIPFITERLWREFPRKPGEHESIMFNLW